jgi:transcription elongation factor Elf1
MLKYKCPECGGKTKNRIQVKDGSEKIAAPCGGCQVKISEKTHEIIAKICLDYVKRNNYK